MADINAPTTSVSLMQMPTMMMMMMLYPTTVPSIPSGSSLSGSSVVDLSAEETSVLVSDLMNLLINLIICN